ncbi:hypothetical protein CC2G_000263 [Coprinopsis cinerea AmutBmut pab1-1]|nr:hypothetical protein CC2G_000263 [Coprinopsis cinerea AmutBmut pab1-1]
MSSSSKITISYELNPPSEIQGEGLAKSKTQSFEVGANPEGDQKAYYAALQAAVVKAKNAIGDDLTAWRDKVGKAELNKEPKPRNEESDEEEEEEDAEDA